MDEIKFYLISLMVWANPNKIKIHNKKMVNKLSLQDMVKLEYKINLK